MAVLEYITVTAVSTAQVSDGIDALAHPDAVFRSGNVDFIARVPKGFAAKGSTLVPPQLVTLDTIHAHFDPTDGVLKSGKYVPASPGGGAVELIANSAALGITELIYDVVFYDLLPVGKIAPFGFLAPTATGTVDLATVTRLPARAGLI